ncbi:MAG: hypothetical protein Ta2B_10490 [Termitinemataceae bacterium]|nr:MAG: hypothetical protein Ta2B_10490 [Termitinemataceae bacterium]
MSLIGYVTAVIGLLYEVAILSLKFFKAPQKVITLLETIEQPLMIIVIAVLTYCGFTAATPEVVEVVKEAVEVIQ